MTFVVGSMVGTQGKRRPHQGPTVRGQTGEKTSNPLSGEGTVVYKFGGRFVMSTISHKRLTLAMLEQDDAVVIVILIVLESLLDLLPPKFERLVVFDSWGARTANDVHTKD